MHGSLDIIWSLIFYFFINLYFCQCEQTFLFVLNASSCFASEWMTLTSRWVEILHLFIYIGIFLIIINYYLSTRNNINTMFHKKYTKAFEPKWVNPNDIQYGVNSLWLGGFLILLWFSKFQIIHLKIESLLRTKKKQIWNENKKYLD